MRGIVVSMDVFAALWAHREAGEESENAIMERLLGLPKGPPLPTNVVINLQRRPGPGRNTDSGGGIYNDLFDVHFPQGFEVFRNYKGRDYLAVVRDGRWIMGGESFRSLFALSMAIIDSRENPWMHWKYRDQNGRINTISTLRKIPPEWDESVSPNENQSLVQKKKQPRNTSKKARQ